MNALKNLHERCAAKGYGIARAKQALYEKKIPKCYWDAALAEYPDQTEHMLRFLRSRLDEDSAAQDRAADLQKELQEQEAQLAAVREELELANQLLNEQAEQAEFVPKKLQKLNKRSQVS